MTKFITVEMAVAVNHKVILEHSPDEMTGIKDNSMLESAIARPQQSVFGEDAYNTIFLKAAALLESLAQNHPFHNANKRTAFLCTSIFLSMNGYILRFRNQQVGEDFVVDVVNHHHNLEGIANILALHSTTK